MKKFLFVSILLLSGISIQAQINDLEFANMLIGQDVRKLDSILISTGYEYTITDKKINRKGLDTKFEIYIDSQFGGIKLWEIESEIPLETPKYDGDVAMPIPGEPEYISTIFVRYRHSNMGDLKDFKSYELSTVDHIEYEKELGRKLSHLKVKFHKRFN